MTDLNPEDVRELRRLRRLLRMMGRLAKDASLTGSFPNAGAVTAQQYNAVLARLVELGAVPRGLFPPVAHDATLDAVGISAALAASYIDEEGEAPGHGRGHGQEGPGGHNVVIGLGGLRELRELRELGRTIRDQLPEWLVGRASERDEEEAAWPEEPEAIERRLQEIDGKLHAAAEQLRRSDLPDEQRAELSERVARLARQQARLVRRRAGRRQARHPGGPEEP